MIIDLPGMQMHISDSFQILKPRPKLLYKSNCFQSISRKRDIKSLSYNSNPPPIIFITSFVMISHSIIMILIRNSRSFKSKNQKSRPKLLYKSSCFQSNGSKRHIIPIILITSFVIISRSSIMVLK